MDLKSTFELTYHFLAANFPDSRSIGLTDRDVIIDVVNRYSEKEVLILISQCRSILKLKDFPWNELSDATLLNYGSKESAKAWLENVFTWFCEEYEKKYGKPPIID